MLGESQGYDLDPILRALPAETEPPPEQREEVDEEEQEEPVPHPIVEPAVVKKKKKIVVRIKPKRGPYCRFGEWNDDKKYYSVVNDGSVYETPEEKAHRELKDDHKKWLASNFVPSGQASAIPLRQAGGVAHVGPFFDDVILEKICRVDDHSKDLVPGGWHPIADREQPRSPTMGRR